MLQLYHVLPYIYKTNRIKMAVTKNVQLKSSRSRYKELNKNKKIFFSR